MTDTAMDLLFRPLEYSGQAAQQSTGVLPYQGIRALVREKEIVAAADIEASQYQPASLDLRLGDVAYRVRASFMPGNNATVRDKIDQFGTHEIDLTKGAVLESSCVYIVPLQEQANFRSKVSAFANPKSSIGRLDVFTRLITDNGTTFDRVERDYAGPLFVEIAPRTFSIKVKTGSRVNQLRFRRGLTSTVLSQPRLKDLHQRYGLVKGVPNEPTFKDNTVGVTLDLNGDPSTHLVGFRAKRHSDVIDIDQRGHYDPADYWDFLYARHGTGIVLNPDDFYILATKETVTVPPDHAAEMVAYDTLVGEFRVHYAGFFDPGFGFEGNDPKAYGTKAVLEVRSHEVPFILEHEQIIGWLRYERLTGPTDRPYGAALGSSYQSQGLTLGKQFKPLT